MNILRILSILLLCTLLSCEGVLSRHGHVYDKMTEHGIDSVQVILVLGKDDTIWKCAPPVTADGTDVLTGDNYRLAFTDSLGYFSISSGLIGMGPGEVKAKLIFTKKGYATIIAETDELSKLDSVHMQHL